MTRRRGIVAALIGLLFLASCTNATGQNVTIGLENEHGEVMRYDCDNTLLPEDGSCSDVELELFAQWAGSTEDYMSANGVGTSVDLKGPDPVTEQGIAAAGYNACMALATVAFGNNHQVAFDGFTSKMLDTAYAPHADGFVNIWAEAGNNLCPNVATDTYELQDEGLMQVACSSLTLEGSQCTELELELFHLWWESLGDYLSSPSVQSLINYTALDYDSPDLVTFKDLAVAGFEACHDKATSGNQQTAFQEYERKMSRVYGPDQHDTIVRTWVEAGSELCPSASTGEKLTD